jgi:hypothetical protein
MTVVTAPRRLQKLRRAQGEAAPLEPSALHFGLNGSNGTTHAGRGRCPSCGELLKCYLIVDGREGCWVAKNWRRWLSGQALASRRHTHEGETAEEQRARLAGCRARRRGEQGRFANECS